MHSPRRAPAEIGNSDDRLTFVAVPALAVSSIGLALALAGFAAVGPPLAVPGAALLALGVLSALSTYLVATGVHVRGRTVHATVTEGELVELELIITGHRLLGLSGATLEHSLLAEPFALAHTPGSPQGLDRLRALINRDPRRLPLSGRARRRGRLVIPAPRVTISDALGLAHAERHGDGEMGELLVLPRIEPVRWFDADIGGAAAHARTAVAGTEATDLAGLRDYQPGTPATRIYWPALARGGTLLERFYEGEVDIAPLIVVDPRCAGGPDDVARLDAVIRAAASLTLDLARGGGVDLLLPGRGSLVRVSTSLGAWPDAHRALAVVEAQSATAPAPALPAGRDGVLFYACAYPSLVAAAQRRWAGRMLTLTPQSGSRAAATPVAEVAGCIATPPEGL